MADENTPLPPPDSAIVRIRRVTDDTGVGEAPPGTISPIPTTPPVVVVQPPTSPPSTGTSQPPSSGGTAPAPEYPAPEPVVLDWWQKLAIETRAQLEAQLASIKSALDIANSVLQETLGRLATLESKPPSQGLKGDKGDPGLNGTNGKDGKDGTNGRDGKDGSLFVSTPEYAALSARIDTADGKAAIAQSSADAQSARNNSQDAFLASLQRQIAGISQTGGGGGGGATVAQIALAVQDYFTVNPVQNGRDGKDGKDGKDGINADTSNIPSINTVKAWVDEEIGRLDIPALVRSLVPATTTGGGGGTTAGVTIDQVRQAVAAALEPLQGFMSDAEAYVWGLILNANDEFWTLFLDRIGTVEFTKDDPEFNDLYRQFEGVQQ